MSTTADPPPQFLSIVTVLSLLVTLAIALTAYFASIRFLPANTASKLRTLYIWHLADALTHFILEGSYLYNCFFSYIPRPPVTSDYPHPASVGRATVPVLYGLHDRLYGSAYGTSPMAKLWQEYARADKRWGEADLTVISLELLTVFLAGPIAVYVSELIRRGAGGDGGGANTGKMWFWASVLATGELYGGFMTFAPEWLSGSPNLDTSNFMYLWVYLVFLNTLWVWLPLWILYEAFQQITAAFVQSSSTARGKKNA